MTASTKRPAPGTTHPSPSSSSPLSQRAVAPLSQRAVARALGISRTWLQVLERRALRKLALRLGLPDPGVPRWAKQYEPRPTTRGASPRDPRTGRFS
jgi:hypothetical protein